MPRDARPTQAKPRSKKATALTTVPSEAMVRKTYHPPMTTVKQDKSRASKFKEFMRKSKAVGSKVASGIKTTADVVGRVAESMEPFIDAAAAANPEFAAVLGPLAVVDTAMAETHKLVGSTAKAAGRGADAYKQYTDTGKYQKMMAIEAPPKVNLMGYTQKDLGAGNYGYQVGSSMMDLD